VTASDKQGKKLDLTVRVTRVYKKTRGQWLIIHEHVSVPVDLDTGKPDLASKPWAVCSPRLPSTVRKGEHRGGKGLYSSIVAKGLTTTVSLD